MDLNKRVNVKNRSTATAGYTLPDSGIRRTWAPLEVKKGITVAELEQATYIAGGLVILQDYLQINDKEVCEYLGIETEPEYFYTEEDIVKLLSQGTLEQFLDCLDFAPDGILDMIKKVSVETKLNDISKRQAIQEKLGFNVNKAIEMDLYSKEIGTSEGTPSTGRRSNPINQTNEENTPVTAGSKYRRVQK